MKKFLITLCSFTFANCLFGASLISFTDNSPSTSFAGLLSSSSLFVGSWTETVAASNVSISAILDSKVGPIPGTAFLTNAIGPGTTITNQIATNTFVAPATFNPANLQGAPYTQLFSGLNLSPGTYYLVLQGSAGGTDTQDWYGDFNNVGVTTASGWSVGRFYNNTSTAAYGPASKFVADSGFSLFYTVAAVATPEPTSFALITLGSFAAFLLRFWKTSRAKDTLN